VQEKRELLLLRLCKRIDLLLLIARLCLNLCFLESVGGPAWSYFSAVCWLYGSYLYDELKIPIGLVDSDWGGTPVEAWSSPRALEECGLSNSQV